MGSISADYQRSSFGISMQKLQDLNARLVDSSRDDEKRRRKESDCQSRRESRVQFPTTSFFWSRTNSVATIISQTFSRRSSHNHQARRESHHARPFDLAEDEELEEGQGFSNPFQETPTVRASAASPPSPTETPPAALSRSCSPTWRYSTSTLSPVDSQAPTSMELPVPSTIEKESCMLPSTLQSKLPTLDKQRIEQGHPTKKSLSTPGSRTISFRDNSTSDPGSTTRHSVHTNLPERIAHWNSTVKQPTLADENPSHSPARSKSAASRLFLSSGKSRSRHTMAVPGFASFTWDSRDEKQQHSVTPDPIYESLRFLDDDFAPNLQLEDYHKMLHRDAPTHGHENRPSLRRHISISRLNFTRSPTSMSHSSSKELPTSPSPQLASPTITPAPFQHARKKSRALSLTLNATSRPSTAALPADTEPATAHYRNPEARKTLRACLATPKDFDDALEYGFPAHEEAETEAADLTQPVQVTKAREEEPPVVNQWLRLSEDDKASFFSDGATATEPESPKTPGMPEKALPPIPPVPESTHKWVRPEGAPRHVSSGSREMTMRMTLTRPDLRTNEDDVYGWQKGYMARKAHSRTGSLSPKIYVREALTPKEEMERRFAEFDGEDAMNQSHGPMRRLWHRVRGF